MSLMLRSRELRKSATRAEQHLWFEFLRLCRPRVRRQHVLAGFILDFYCSKLHLAIELDGAGHFSKEGMARDAERSAILERHGVRVVRFENRVVLEELQVVVEVLARFGLRKGGFVAVSVAIPSDAG
jgi:very-short-patch-repair endonuclease